MGARGRYRSHSRFSWCSIGRLLPHFPENWCGTSPFLCVRRSGATTMNISAEVPTESCLPSNRSYDRAIHFVEVVWLGEYSALIACGFVLLLAQYLFGLKMPGGWVDSLLIALSAGVGVSIAFIAARRILREPGTYAELDRTVERARQGWSVSVRWDVMKAVLGYGYVTHKRDTASILAVACGLLALVPKQALGDNLHAAEPKI